MEQIFHFVIFLSLYRTMTRCEEMSRDNHKNASRGKTNSWVREENVTIIEELIQKAKKF